MIDVNKVIAMARDFGGTEVVVNSLPAAETEFVVCSDASWANATEKKSQGGYIIAATTDRFRKGGWALVS